MSSRIAPLLVVCSSPYGSSWSVYCLHLKKSSAYALGGVSGVAYFITTDKKLQ